MTATPPELYLNDPADKDACAYAVFGVFGVKHRDAVRVGRQRVQALQARLDAARRLAAIGPDDYRRLTDAARTTTGAALLRQVLDADRADLDLLCRALRLDPEALGERAAIYEFDGGFVRREAERRAVVDTVLSCERLRPFLPMAESGLLLDLAHELVDLGWPGDGA
ncbi:MAG: hypothetical protein LUC93_10980 [Planctomycetaceae bacterium]|nr:hypothetical protein [Planctomycetaceae bacterium]